jgi:transcriptional regulator with XRE-family HTH domain
MGLAIRRNDSLSPVQALVRDAIERLEADYEARGERLVMRRLELANGISNGTIGQLLKGQRQGVSAATAKRIEKVLGVPWRSLVWEGKGGDEPEPGTPAPPTGVRLVVDDAFKQDLDEAFDGALHRPADLYAVTALHQRRAALEAPSANRVLMLRAWLDISARLRKRGIEPTPEAIFDELTLLFTESQREHQRELNERAIAETEQRGYSRPDETPPRVRGLAKTKPPAK